MDWLLNVGAVGVALAACLLPVFLVVVAADISRGGDLGRWVLRLLLVLGLLLSVSLACGVLWFVLQDRVLAP